MSRQTDSPVLIYCASGNPRYAQIAIDAGFLYGAQLPGTIYFSPYFVDQNWKKPDREKYMEQLKKYKPIMASVMDWERREQLSDVLAWAEDAAQYAEIIMIIPKVQNSIVDIPMQIGGKSIRLGYSVPTSHGGTALPYSDFRGWPVHLLGGSPHKQMRLTNYLNVVSVDGNMHQKMANSCRFWRHKTGIKGHWVNMYEINQGDFGKDSNYEAFRLSCKNIKAAWEANCG